MARKVNMNSPDVLKKIESPPVRMKSTTALYPANPTRRRSPQNPEQPTDRHRKDLFSRERCSTTIRKMEDSRFWPRQSSPIVPSQVQRIPGPDFSRTTGREFMGIYKRNSSQIEYNPNHKAVWKGTGKKLLKFEERKGRGELFPFPEFVLESKDVKYSQLDGNVAVPNLGKTTARARDEQVPMFMVNLHYLDRVIGHTVPNYKSLKMNNYMNASFSPLTSSFDSGQRSKISLNSSKRYLNK